MGGPRYSAHLLSSQPAQPRRLPFTRLSYIAGDAWPRAGRPQAIVTRAYRLSLFRRRTLLPSTTSRNFRRFRTATPRKLVLVRSEAVRQASSRLWSSVNARSAFGPRRRVEQQFNRDSAVAYISRRLPTT